MSKQLIFEFLEELSVNNSKEWMDKHRNRYEEAKNVLVELFDPILERIRLFDPRVVQPNARKALNRINNNLMFHPDRPTYKDHFGVGFGYGKGLADFYVHLGVDELLIAGGLWHPPSYKLKLLRQEIDYEGEKLAITLKEQLYPKGFRLYHEDKLKSSPKGYSNDHPHIELLKMKSLAVFKPLSRGDFYSEDFSELVFDSYKAIVPFLDFINTAIAEP